MTRRFNACFSHRTHQLLTRAHALVAAIVGNDEAVHQVALIVRRQNTYQLVHVVVALDQSGREIGMHHAGLSTPHLPVKQLAVFIHEQRPVDDAHGTVAVQHRHRMQLGVGQKNHRQFIVAGLQTHSGGLNHGESAQRPGVGGPAQLREHGHPPVLHHFQRLRLDLLVRRHGRAAQKIALPVGDAQVTQHPQIGLGFNAFGHQRCVKNGGNLLQSLYCFQLVSVLTDIFGEVFVDLHNLGFELRPQAQA